MVGLRVNNALDNACRLCEKLTIVEKIEFIIFESKINKNLGCCYFCCSNKTNFQNSIDILKNK
jgi:hypothetical protein